MRSDIAIIPPLAAASFFTEINRNAMEKSF